MGLSVSKAGARDRAIEQSMRVMDNREVTVIAVQRRWKQRNYPDLVLTSEREGTRDHVPPFFSPPEGTQDYEKDREIKQRKIKQKIDNSYQGPQNVHHLGPSVTGRRMENFVIMLKPNENPVGILNTSAQFCKMGVDFYFEKAVCGGDDFICTVFIEGQAVADGKGPKKTLKHVVSDNALKCLSKMCHTVVITESGIDKGSLKSRKDVKKQAEVKPKLEENNVGNRMLRMMGWKEGEGLGNRSDAIVEPIQIKNESINKEGLGSKAINSDNITREEANEIIKNYASSDAIEDLTFASELSFDERKEIKMMAKRYGLSERTVMENNYGRKRVFLVLSKKIGPEVIIEQLEQEGSWGRYQLVRPEGGDRYVISRYLNYQNLRQSKGVPTEVFDHRTQGFGRSRGGESYENRGGGYDRNASGFNAGRGSRETDEGSGWSNRSRFQRDMGGFGNETFRGIERGFESFGRGGGSSGNRNIRSLMSNQATQPSFTIGSSKEGREMNKQNSNMSERSGFSHRNTERNEEMGSIGGAYGRQEGGRKYFDNYGGSNNLGQSSVTSGQFWQKMGGGFSGASSRSYTIRGRKSNC